MVQQVRPNHDKACEALARIFYQITDSPQPMTLVSTQDLTYLVIMASLWADEQ